MKALLNLQLPFVLLIFALFVTWGERRKRIAATVIERAPDWFLTAAAVALCYRFEGEIAILREGDVPRLLLVDVKEHPSPVALSPRITAALAGLGKIE